MASTAGLLPHGAAVTDSTTLHCCCGRADCALLKRNCSVLETVEKDVHTAAQLGQVSRQMNPFPLHSDDQSRVSTVLWIASRSE